MAQNAEDDVTCRAEMSELQQSLVTALTASGVLGKLRAQLRLASLAIIRDDSTALETVFPARMPLQQLTAEQRIGLLIVDEFLASLNLTLTQGTFEEEASIAAVRASQPAGFDRMPKSATGQTMLQSLIGAALTSGAASVIRPQSASSSAPINPGRSASDEELLTDWSASAAPPGPQSSQTIRAPSPSVEVVSSVRTTIVTSSTTITSSSGSTGSAETTSGGAAKTRASSVPIEAEYEPSVDYSDHSVASSLDVTEFDHVELVKQQVEEAQPVAESTSDDDF